MNPFHHLNDRRSFLKGVSLGAGGLLLAPLLQKVAAAADGKVTPPKRVIFFVFDNGFLDTGALPVGEDLYSSTARQIPLKGLKLPLDIEPFAPFQDRMTLIQGLRCHTSGLDHGGQFAALSGSSGRKQGPQAESIDAALARLSPTAVPLLHLGISSNASAAAYCCSAWGRGNPIPALCWPEQVCASLFGNVGGDRNEFASRRNLLDFVTDDVRRLRNELAGPERELVDAHVGAMEDSVRRMRLLAEKFADGTLQRHAPKLKGRPGTMTEIAAAQCDIAAAALTAGLTNVVTITAGLCGQSAPYTGISNLGPHGFGHGGGDPSIGLKTGAEVLSVYHNYLAAQAARMLETLRSTREGNGTMLDNTVLVFTSDCANLQHARKGANWPFVLVGNLGGRLRTGKLLAYPLSAMRGNDWPTQVGQAEEGNPLRNALYCSLLHAFGAPRSTFNRSPNAPEAATLYGPLEDLLA